jgi:hypothetical protein
VSFPTDTPRFFTLPEAPISPKACTEVPTSTIVARKVDHPTTTTGNQSFGGGANASVEVSVRGHGGRGDDGPSLDDRDCTKGYLKSAIDPFAAAQIKSGRLLKILVCVDPVEQLDPKPGEILGRFQQPSGSSRLCMPRVEEFFSDQVCWVDCRRRRGRKGGLFGGDIGRFGSGWSEMEQDLRGADRLSRGFNTGGPRVKSS